MKFKRDFLGKRLFGHPPSNLSLQRTQPFGTGRFSSNVIGEVARLRPALSLLNDFDAQLGCDFRVQPDGNFGESE